MPGAHQQEPLSPILRLGVNPFSSGFICRTALRGGFAHTQFRDPIKTELDRVYCSVYVIFPHDLALFLRWRSVRSDSSVERDSFRGKKAVLKI